MARSMLFCRHLGFGPLASMVARQESEIALGRLFQEEGLTHIQSDPIAPLSFASMSAIFERAARLTGDQIFGVQVGLGMRPEDYGPFAQYALAAPTLENAIRRACDLALLQTNAVTLTLQVEGDEAAWSLGYRSGPGIARLQHALHILPSLIRTVQGFMGSSLPVEGNGQMRLETAIATVPLARTLEDAVGLRVWRDMDRYALVFPRAWLGMPSPERRPHAPAFCDLYKLYFPRLPRTAAEAVTLVLEPRLADGVLHVEDVARRLGMSRRKLQGDLNGEGFSFRDILRQMRMRRAMRLMRETRDTLTEIALSVGYSDQAHFHRAFVAVTGLSPGEWRGRTAATRN